MDRISRRGQAVHRLYFVGLGISFFFIADDTLLLAQVVTCSLHQSGLQLSEKYAESELAPPSPRSWFPSGKGRVPTLGQGSFLAPGIGVQVSQGL